jgi:hypothetical protein
MNEMSVYVYDINGYFYRKFSTIEKAKAAPYKDLRYLSTLDDQTGERWERRYGTRTKLEEDNDSPAVARRLRHG